MVAPGHLSALDLSTGPCACDTVHQSTAEGAGYRDPVSVGEAGGAGGDAVVAEAASEDRLPAPERRLSIRGGVSAALLRALLGGGGPAAGRPGGTEAAGGELFGPRVRGAVQLLPERGRGGEP